MTPGVSPAQTQDLAATPDAQVVVETATPINLPMSLAPLAHGRGDPTVRLEPWGAWRATRTPEGPATMRFAARDSAITVSAWGDGAGWATHHAADQVGANDQPEALIPQHAVIAEQVRRLPGLRLPASLRPFDALLPAICEQKITGVEARAVFRAMLRAHGEPAPGPGGLRLAPDPSVLADLPYYAFHRFGLERRRAELIRHCAALAPRLDGMTAQQVGKLLGRVRGIGPWTVAEVTRVAYGDPDALSVGDYHIASMVAWALAGEAKADDARMLELLQPYRGQRGRIQRLLEVSGVFPPRRGPRMASRNIAGI
jgi:3-methyladenine DNA glycosylase/8-oxoguanine DNA glycosylase